MWVLINAYYNEAYGEKDEWKRVLHFGRDFGKVFGELDKIDVEVLVNPECVGGGMLTEPPNRYVKKASEVLRRKLGIADNCEKCRTSKKRRCRDIQPENYDFQNFEALMRILYQIRCNLFHGEKLDRDVNQQRRNHELVIRGDTILRRVLEEVARK